MFFFFNDTATTEIYTLSLQTLFRSRTRDPGRFGPYGGRYVPETLMAALEELDRVHEAAKRDPSFWTELNALRSEEHTSELQSRLHLVCRLLLEKKKAPLLSHSRIVD